MDPVSVLAGHIRQVERNRPNPILVALDGRSAAGKSTLAASVAPLVHAVVLDGDDFYSGGSADRWEAMSAAEKVSHCIDWKRQRAVLEKLAKGEAGFLAPLRLGGRRRHTGADACHL